MYTWQEKAIWAEGYLDGICSLLTESSTVLDLGANRGTITKKLMATGARTFSFEPDPWAFSRLEMTTQGAKNVTIYNKAVGKENGTVKLHRHPNLENRPNKLSQSSSIVAADKRFDEWGDTTIDVEIVDIGEFLQNLIAKHGKIDFIKMDIEGAEYEVLERMEELDLIRNVSSIVVEVHAHKMERIKEYGTAVEKRLSKKYSENHLRLDWI